MNDKDTQQKCCATEDCGKVDCPVCRWGRPDAPTPAERYAQWKRDNLGPERRAA